MTTLSTLGWALHDLGLAASFGGVLFGKIGLQPAAKEIQSVYERQLVVSKAWRRFSFVNTLSLGLLGATWFFGRSFLSGREVGGVRGARSYVIGKDVLVGLALAGGLGSVIAGILMSRREPSLPIRTSDVGVGESVVPNRSLERFVGILGDINLAASAGAIATNAILAQKAGKSTVWSFVSRMLP